MAPRAEQQLGDKLPKFACTSASADFIKNYLLPNVKGREDVVGVCVFSNVTLLLMAPRPVSSTGSLTEELVKARTHKWPEATP